MSDFSMRPFAAGSLVGVRSFKVDSLGRLCAPMRDYIFTPDENAAECLQTPPDTMMRELEKVRLSLAGCRIPPDAEKGHRTGSLGCGCGFYAYYDGGDNPYHRSSFVVGLIEGYGVCSVGTRGFRAEKGRLVALVDPSLARGKGRRHRLWDRWSDWHYRKGWQNTATVAAGGMGAVYSVVGCVGLSADGRFAWAALCLLAAVLLGTAAIQAARGWGHGLSRDFADIHPELTCVSRAGGPDLALVRRNYPDVPVYPSLKAALAEHPLTVPSEPDPEDPNFWTLGVAS